MFGRILTSLLTERPDRLPQPDAQRALAALLVRLARADEHYDEDERARIDRIIARRYDLSPFEAVTIRTDAEELEAEAPDTVRFTRALKEAVPYEDRMGLMEALWSVALVDDARDPREDAMIRVTADLLGISDKDRAIARQNVEKSKT
ncbi:MAG: TerB family tellurite resistance protein [Albidovulum sp.]